VELLKIDVEGAELEVLQGAESWLRCGRIREVLCEVHEPTASRIEVEELLRSCGFSVDSIGEAELHAVWKSSGADRCNGTDRKGRIPVISSQLVPEGS